MLETKERVKLIKDLYAEVVVAAIEDFKARKEPEYTDAKEFLESEWLEFYLSPLNIHPDFIRRELCLTSVKIGENS